MINLCLDYADIETLRQNGEIIDILAQQIKIQLSVNKGNKIARFPNCFDLLFATSATEKEVMEKAHKGDKKAIEHLKEMYNSLRVYTDDEIIAFQKGRDNK